LGRRPGTRAFLSLDEYPDSETYPGLLVMRFDAGLYFATSDALEDGIRQYAQDAEPPLRTVVLDFEGVNFIDSQGTDEVGKLVDLATAAEAEIRLARVKAPVLRMLERDGVIDRLGADNIYGNVYQAVADLIPQETEGS
jgi:MFS superfamily sulfate permease-like transporter